MYVTDTISHCVFVFTTNGEYSTSFGQCGKKDGDFNFPSYVDNSFVYVAYMHIYMYVTYFQFYVYHTHFWMLYM